MITDQHEMATLVAEKLYQKVKDDLITSGTGIINEVLTSDLSFYFCLLKSKPFQELTELTGMKHKLEERLDLIEETNSERFASLEETIEENKISNNQKLESLVESNDERLDSLKETIEENEVSNNERLDFIEETLEKNKQNQIYFSA